MSDIRRWLEGLSPGENAEAFEVEKFDLEAVRYLDDHVLEKLGVPVVLRRKLLAAIATAPRR